MDEDLKIVLTSELEADEEASAQRISAQLPNIAKLINSKSSIKVGVTLDEAGIQSQTQRITQQIARATKSQSVGVSLSLDQSSVNKIKTELNNLKVSPDISRAMTDQLDQMGIQIDRITGRWEAVNGEEERMLNLTIQGTDQMQRTVTYLQTYNAETGEINTHLTNVTANLERQRREQEQVAAQAKKDNESRVSYLNRQKALLADIQAAYVGQTSVKPITDSAHLTALNDTYAAVNARIETMIAAEGRLDNVQRSNLEAQISGLQRLVKEYQNAEYVATKLRTKDIGSIKADQLSGLEALEKRLESAGTLTDTFKSKIDGLKKTLQGVGTKDQLVAFLNSFDQLNNDVAVFQERLRGANKIYTQLISLDKQITSVQSSMTKLNTSDDKNKLLALQGQLSVLNNQRAALEAQLVPYADIIQYAKQATALEQSRLLNGTQLVYTQMELADKARDYDVAMQSIPSTIADLQTKFSQVVAPTENLVQNMRLLRETAAQYGADMGDREKVATYERLQSLIGACSKEMSELLRVQRGDVNDFKFTQNLEKAKADLETVGRTWSALKQDPGLNAQFQQLSENLKRVDNQMDLRKWTAQFSTFKSEVKAAGKNMQSLGDILKNNVGKVLQWVSATTLLFRAFRLLRSALTTIVDLDTAMIDLQKVTTATREEYDRFYHSANGTAKALGVTTEEVISQTAEWARLGYAMQDAAKLAENSAIFEAISPDMDITQATDGLVSIIKAYDLDVEDSLDGIISKVNEVGNKFAVSNGDIVEAMTRSSAAMAAANNTFEETVALATAAIEITRDAATVGNGLKTLSMRIRGYDEETEEYSADVSELTGTIADLTKVASNNNRGISLFEADDPETYRSTYDILSDIADIWDELTDKNRANLLEALFGKRQAQIGAAILSNFDQARSAIVKMEESAGSAGREMDKITQSLDYKLNALKETWVGVAQNLFQTDGMKLVVDALNLVSNGIDQLTEKLGLFGTIGLVGAIALIYKFRAEMNMLQSTVLPVTEAIRASGVVMDGSATSVQYYATKLMELDKFQRAAAMSALGLTAEQKKQVMTMTSLITSAQRYTIQELAEKAATDKTTAATLAKNMAKATEKRTTEQITVAMMTEILNSKKLTAAQKEAIVAALQQTAANEKQAFSLKVLGANAKAAFAAMAINPMTWITLAVTAVMGLVQVWQSVKQRAEEARQSMTEAAEAANDQRNSLADLIAEYKELATACDFDSSARETAKRIQKDITDLVGAQADNLDLVNGKLDDEIKKLDNIKLQAAYDARDTLDTKYRDAMSRYNQGINAEGSGTNFLGVVTDAGGIDQILRKIGFVNDAWENVNGQISISYALAGKNAEEVLAMYKELQHVLLSDDSWQSMADSWLGDSSQDVLNNVQRQIEFYQGLVDDYNSAQENFLKNEAVIDLGETLKTTDINTQDAFDGYIQGIKDSTEYSEAYKKILLELANDTFPEFSGAMQQATNNGDTSVYIAQLEAEKAVLQAKMEAAQTQLDLAKAVAEGEGDISKELAEYRINAGNAVAQALIDAGVDEATAFKLAAAAMAQNAEEFNRVAAEVCTDVNGNFNQAAYDLAQTMYNNLTSVKTDLASVAKQAHQTAKAIAGVASGTVAGSADVQGGFGGGTGGSGIKLNLTSGSFKGTEYSYTAKESNLEDFISQIELDVSKYQDAISQIDGQIAALQPLKNAPLKSFKSDTKSGSSSKKDVEEYVATIDDYREAVERLRKTQEARAELETKIDNSDDLREKILLERQLIGAYQREQEALQNLNDQRESTISSGAKALRDLGFEVQYNADTNELWIANMEHLNELVADSKGGYDTLQEATNGLRKETEDLINSLTDLNEENRDGSESWKELGQDIKEARKQITELLDGIVEEASDAVDTIQNVYDTLHDAADEYAQSGFITVDTLQSIIGLGQKYVAYLIDENGQLVINEERIQAVIAARTQQMAIESSLAYVEALRMAKSEGDIATLNNLLYATEQATNATWGLVYANLALAGLDEDQYQAALRNINAIRAMADSAVQSIGKTVGGVTDELEEMQNGLNDILDYVMDMLKQRIQDQIDGLEDMKDAYSEIIDLKKQSLEASKDEADHQKTMASKMREIAKLQARIDMLSLDDSREAQAEKAALLKELSELQSDLADEQADRTLEAQEDALDKMEESYHDEKDKEIGILEDSISSHQKLYDMAISYIESHWDTLYSELISWNTQYGDVLNSDITNAWDNCLAAAQRYGSYVSALGSIGGDIKATQSSGTNFQVGNATYDNSSSGEDMIHAIIKEMYANSKQHAYEDAAGKLYLNRRNLELGAQLAQYGITAVRGSDGVWYVDRVGGQLLYDKYRKYTYHEGGIVGGGDIKSNEQLSLLKTKEWVLSEQMVDNLTTQMDRINMLSDAMSDLPDYAGKSTLSDVMKQVGGGKTVNNITNNSRPIEVQIGDTIIHGADQSTVDKHIKVTRDMVNQIGRLIGIGR